MDSLDVLGIHNAIADSALLVMALITDELEENSIATRYT